MALRKTWQDAKSNSFEAFKKFGPKLENPEDIVTHGPPPYPLKFKEDLGPLLDKYEAAKKKNGKDTDKFKADAYKVIDSYSRQIANEKKNLGDVSAKFLTDALTKIKTDLA